MREVVVERNGWRDEKLSLRHRSWGFHVPAIDVDFLVVEYRAGKPCALVEYKHKQSRPVDNEHQSFRAMKALANGEIDAPLPCFVVRYDDENWSFVVDPLNEAASRFYAHCAGKPLSEQRFVKSLYLLRRPFLTEDEKELIQTLNSETA